MKTNKYQLTTNKMQQTQSNTSSTSNEPSGNRIHLYMKKDNGSFGIKNGKREKKETNVNRFNKMTTELF